MKAAAGGPVAGRIRLGPGTCGRWRTSAPYRAVRVHARFRLSQGDVGSSEPHGQKELFTAKRCCYSNLQGNRQSLSR